MGKSSTQSNRRRRRQERMDNGGDENSNKAKMSKTTTSTEAGNSHGAGGPGRQPLSEVISNCVVRWFQDTLKEAKAGDINMQVLVGQMYLSGYGIPRDENMGEFWIAKAARIRPSVWNVCDKRPGYNASDSDSDESASDS